MSWRQWPLAAKLTLAMTGLVILAVAGVTLASVQREQATFRAELEQQAQLLLNTLEVATRNALYTLDADFMGALMEDFGAAQTGASSRVYGSDGRIIADSALPDELRFSLEGDAFAQRLLASQTVVFDWQADALVAGQPVIAGRQPLGAISVTLPTAPLVAKMDAVRSQGIGLALVAAFAGALLSLIVSRTITGPLRQLTEATERISGGDLTHRITVRSGDELALLAGAFNKMSGQLHETLQSLEQRAGDFQRANVDLVREVAERERAEREVERQREEYEIIFDSLPIMFWYKDTRNRVLRLNRAAAQFEGTSREALEGKPSEELYPPEQAAAFYADDLEVIRSGQPKLDIIEQHTVPATGEIQWVQTGKVPYRDRDGQITGVIVFALDITDRLEAEAARRESEERYRLILEASPDPVVIYDLQGSAQYVNPAFVQTFGWAEAELLGKRIDFVPEEEVPATRAALQSLLNAERSSGFETRRLTREGSILNVLLSGALLRDVDGNLTGSVILFRDISERKQAEQERERMIAELQAANTKAIEASRLKSEFLATMSHELRTPLNAVIGFSGIMLEGMAGQLDDQARHMMQAIYDNGHNLLRLINDVLDLSKIEAGRMELMMAPLSIPELIARWQSQMDVIAQQKGLPFQVEVDPDLPQALYGDQDRLRQIVVNLLSNAFKFTEQGQVTLEVKWESEALLIRVCDTGVGIPPHALNYIFDEFRQVDSSSQRQYGGTGLGLAIVRRLCLIMGGSIQVSSKLGEGSVFTVNLPLQPAA